MPSQRLLRINELIKQEVAGFVYRTMNEENFDISAVTVTRVVTSSDLRQARVLVSIRGDTERQEKMIRQLMHHRKDFQDVIARHIKMKYTPHIQFELDPSIAEGDNVLGIIADMESEHPEWKDEKPEPDES